MAVTGQRARAAKRRQERAESRKAWRALVMERDEGRCQMDHDHDGPVEAHHILPSGRGGRDELDNGIALCKRAHMWVHAHPAAAYELGLLRRSGSTL